MRPKQLRRRKGRWALSEEGKQDRFFVLHLTRTNSLLFSRLRLLGFLCGSVVAGASAYYYVVKEYRLSNEMLTEDIYVRYCI